MCELIGYSLLGVIALFWVMGHFYIKNKEDDCHQCDDYFNEKWNTHNERMSRKDMND